MYASVHSKEAWHREGDVFLKITDTGFRYGDVKLQEKSDTLNMYWSRLSDLGVKSVMSFDEFNQIDFRNVHLIDQRFSLGEIVYSERLRLDGEVVGLSKKAVVHVHDSEYVIFGIPMELLKPEVTLDRGKILFKGWVGEVIDKYWTVVFQDGDTDAYSTKDIVITKIILPSSPYPKTFIPVVGSTMKLGSKKRKVKIIYRQLRSVRVEWYHRLKHYPHESSVEPPPMLIENPEIIKELIEFDTNHIEECKKTRAVHLYYERIRSIHSFERLGTNPLS